eukprot:Skav205237  [mRNA]  locus=scaffold1794:241395:247080:+ [translate_table: standard]
MAGRGGSRHTSKPHVDEGLLLKVFSKNSDLLRNMGSYERISKSQAADPRGLVALLPMIQGLVELQPTCEIHTSSLRKAIFSVLLEDGSLNDSKWSGSVWVGLKVERIGVILFHLRRMAGSDMKAAAACLSGADFLLLKQVVDLINKKEKYLPLTKEVGSPDSLDKRKKLKKEVSDVSLNSDGMPNCFGTPQTSLTKGAVERSPEQSPLTKGECSNPTLPKPSFLRKRPGQGIGSEAAASALQEELGLGRKKNNKKKTAMKAAKSKKKKEKKKQNCQILGHRSWVLPKDTAGARKPWTKLRLTQPRKPPWRVYICGTTNAKGEGKLPLICETTKYGHHLYLEIMQEIKRRLEKDHLTKAEALQLRKHLYETCLEGGSLTKGLTMGKVTENRKIKFAAKAMARELGHMKKEDEMASKMDWDTVKYERPAHLLTKEELNLILNPPEALEKRLDKERVEKERRLLKEAERQRARQPSCPPEALDKRARSRSLDKRGREKIYLHEAGRPKSQIPCQKGRGHEFGPSAREAAKSLAKRDVRDPPAKKDVRDSSPPVTGGASSSQVKAELPSPDWERGSSESSSAPSKRSLDKRATSAHSLAKREKSLDKREGSKVWVLGKRVPKNQIPKCRGKVAIDWHGTLEVEDQVSPANLAALRALKAQGWEVHLLSYGGKKRNKVTLQLAEELWSGWSGIHFTSAKVGWEGKAQRCYDLGIEVIFDDSHEVGWECHQNDMWVYGICPWEKVWKWAMPPKAMKVIKTMKAKSMKATPLPKGKKGLPKAMKGLPKAMKGLPKAKKALLKAKNLAKLGTLTLAQKVKKISEAHDDPEEAAKEVKENLTKQEHSRVWSKYQTFLSKEGAEEKKEFENASKQKKGLMAAMHMLKDTVPKFVHLAESLKQGSSLDKREKWVSEAKMLEEFGEAEFYAHLDSGRISWRQDPWTTGVWNYRDNGDYTVRKKVSKTRQFQVGQEYTAGEAEEDPWDQILNKDLHAHLSEVDTWGQGNSLTKGKGKGKALTKGKGKGRGQLAIEDGKAEEENKTEEEQWKSLLAKAKRARDQAMSVREDFTGSMQLCDKAKRLTKTRKGEAEEQLKILNKRVTQLKDLLAKGDSWGSLTKAKQFLVDMAKDMKETKDEGKELEQMANKAGSKASKK